jgi:hypothetical protein
MRPMVLLCWSIPSGSEMYFRRRKLSGGKCDSQIVNLMPLQGMILISNTARGGKIIRSAVSSLVFVFGLTQRWARLKKAEAAFVQVVVGRADFRDLTEQDANYSS